MIPFIDKKNAKYDIRGNEIRGGYSHPHGSYSEIEVSEYNDWDAQSIFNRGLKLLSFMERRWNIKFTDDESKKDLLFLNFL